MIHQRDIQGKPKLKASWRFWMTTPMRLYLGKKSLESSLRPDSELGNEWRTALKYYNLVRPRIETPEYVRLTQALLLSSQHAILNSGLKKTHLQLIRNCENFIHYKRRAILHFITAFSSRIGRALAFSRKMLAAVAMQVWTRLRESAVVLEDPTDSTEKLGKIPPILIGTDKRKGGSESSWTSQFLWRTRCGLRISCLHKPPHEFGLKTLLLDTWKGKRSATVNRYDNKFRVICCGLGGKESASSKTNLKTYFDCRYEWIDPMIVLRGIKYVSTRLENIVPNFLSVKRGRIIRDTEGRKWAPLTWLPILKTVRLAEACE